MTKLKFLANQVSKCPQKGGRKKYTEELKKNICSAAKKYGRPYVSESIGVHSALISKWASKLQTSTPPKKKVSEKSEIVSFKEISPLNIPVPTAGPSLRLISPSGLCLELSQAQGENTLAIIRAFMGGAA